MISFYEGEKRNVGFKVTRVRGSGTVALTTPERRVLSASRAVLSGYDWAAATWDETVNELYCLFDSTVAAISAPGTYYVQLRGDISAERYQKELTVVVKEWGP